MTGVTKLSLPALREDRSRFVALRDSRVLIYWPHGLGDWVHFGGVLPLLEPSNTYGITRFGDDYVSLMEGSALIEPLFSGVRSPQDGASRGARHLGLSLHRCVGRKVSVTLPPPLDDAVMRFAPEVVLWTDYPETEGRTAYPFHTKARNLIRLLVRGERLATVDLAAPLRNAIDFRAPSATQQRIDERLARFAQPAGRLGVISRSGVTAVRKTGVTVRKRARSSLQCVARRRTGGSYRWMTRISAKASRDSARSSATSTSPLRDSTRRLYDASISSSGSPPAHYTSRWPRGHPTIGLWIAHHPDWYEEPNPDAIHLIGRYVRDQALERRPATTTKPPSLRHRLEYLDTHAVTVEPVIEAARTLTG